MMLMKYALKTRERSFALVLQSLKRWESSLNKQIILGGKVDRHNCISVDLSQVKSNEPEQSFKHSLKESLNLWRQLGHRAVWLYIPIGHSKLITVASEFNFNFHHSKRDHSVLTLCLDNSVEEHLPSYATHQIGVSGIVYRADTQQILMIKDANRPYNLWKFPGGLSHLGENIGDATRREIKEETGIESEFQSILAFRQQHNQPGAFGCSDIFIVSRMKPVSFDLQPCATEIQDAEWMTLHEIESSNETAPILVRMIQLFKQGLTCGFQTVDIVGEEMKSIYKGLTYHLYHRPFLDSYTQAQNIHEGKYEVPN